MSASKKVKEGDLQVLQCALGAVMNVNTDIYQFSFKNLINAKEAQTVIQQRGK